MAWGVVHHRLYLHLRMLRLEAVQQRRQHAGSHRHGGPHPQADGPPRVAHGALHLVKQPGDRPGIPQKAIPFPGDVELFAEAFKETGAAVRFDFRDRLADGGLRDVQALGREAHGARLGDGDEDPQMPDGHGTPSYR